MAKPVDCRNTNLLANAGIQNGIMTYRTDESYAAAKILYSASGRSLLFELRNMDVPPPARHLDIPRAAAAHCIGEFMPSLNAYYHEHSTRHMMRCICPERIFRDHCHMDFNIDAGI